MLQLEPIRPRGRLQRMFPTLRSVLAAAAKPPLGDATRTRQGASSPPAAGARVAERPRGPAVLRDGPRIAACFRVVLRSTALYSLAVTAVATASSRLPLRIAVLWPALDGTPRISLTSGSTAHEKRNPPQPLAPSSSANELSTSAPPVRRTRLPDSRISRLPALPLIGLFGDGGLVVPVVRFSTIGFEEEPT